MFEGIANFFKRFGKNEKENSKEAAKERLHLVLAQDRANISADFLEMMKQEIIDVIKKYIDIDEEAIDVRMTNKPGEDGTVGAPALYANIPIVTIKNEARKVEGNIKKQEISKNMQEKIKEEDTLEKNHNEEKAGVESKQKKKELNEGKERTRINQNEDEEENAKIDRKNQTEQLQEDKQSTESKEKNSSKCIEDKKEEIKVEHKEKTNQNTNTNKSTSNHKNKKRKKNK